MVLTSSAPTVFTLTAPPTLTAGYWDDGSDESANAWLNFFDSRAQLLGESSCDSGRVRLFGSRFGPTCTAAV